MKKLLLTLLGAAALCGLSPHPAQAQTTTPEEKTVSFTFSSDAYTRGKVKAGNRAKAVLYSSTDPTDFTLDTGDKVKTLTEAPIGPKQYGWGKIILTGNNGEEDVDIFVDFDFSKSPIASGSSIPFMSTNRITDDYLQVMNKLTTDPGTAFSISLGEGKRIKSVKLITHKSGSSSDFYYKSGTVVDFLRPIECLGNIDLSTTINASGVNSNYYWTSVSFVPASPIGTESLNLIGVKPTADAIINFSGIEVTYFETTEDTPKYDHTFSVGKDFGTPILYKAGDKTEWEEVIGAETVKITESPVKVKLGEAITEFTLPASPKTGQLTAIINGAERWIGTTAGCKFRTYLDPEFTALGNNEAYKVTYTLRGKAPAYTYYTLAGRLISNIAIGSNGVKGSGSTTEMLATFTNPTGLTDADCITANVNPTYDGITGGNKTNDHTNGLAPTVIFQELTLSYTSNNPREQRVPMAASLTMPDKITVDNKGIYQIYGAGKATMTFTDPLYPEAKVYCQWSDDALTAETFDRAKATELTSGSTIDIDDAKPHLALRVYAIGTDGKETASPVISYKFEKAEIVMLDNASQITAALNDKTVWLNFPVNVIAAGTLGTDKLTYMTYGRDLDNNPVVMMSKLAKATDTQVPGNAFKGGAYSQLTAGMFIPAKGVIATVRVNEQGHPILILKDASAGIDHFSECHQTALVAPSSVGSNALFARTLNTHCKAEEITKDLYGRMVWIRNVTYDKSSGKFSNDKGELPVVTAGTKLMIVPSVSNSYQNTQSTTSLSSLTTDDKITICGIVEYDAENDRYYLMYKNQAKTIQTSPAFAFTVAGQIEGDPITEGNVTTAIKLHSTAEVTAAFSSGTNYYAWYIDKNDVPTPFSSQAKSQKLQNYTHINNGVATVHVEDQNVGATGIPFERGEASTLIIKDASKDNISYRTAFSQIDFENDKGFVKIETPHNFHFDLGNASGTWYRPIAMTAYIRGNYMLVRDVATDEEGNATDEQEANPDFFLVYSSKGWSQSVVRAYYRTSKANSATVAEGEGLSWLTMQIADDKMTLDASNMLKPASSNTRTTDDWGFHRPIGNSSAAFISHLNDWRVSSKIENPTEALIDKSYIRKVVEIKGAKIKKAADADSPIMLALKSDIALSWDNLGAVNKTAHQTTIAGAINNASYHILGYVMSDGNGGVKLEVISLECLDNIVTICDHPHHDSYYGKASLDKYADGAVVSFRGTLVTKTYADEAAINANTYTLSLPVGEEEAELVWTTNSTLLNSHRNIINQKMPSFIVATDGSGTVLSKRSYASFNITGTIVKADGKTSLDVATVAATLTSNPDLTVYFNDSPVTTVYDRSFYDYGTIRFSAPEGTLLSYKKVYTKKEDPDNAGEWIDMTADELSAAFLAAEWHAIGVDETIKLTTEDKDYRYQFAGCNPEAGALTGRTFTVKKPSPDVSDINDALASLEENLDPQVNYMHMHGALRVASAATIWPYGNLATVTDGTGHYLVISLGNDENLPKPGTMLNDFAISNVKTSSSKAIGGMNFRYQYTLIDRLENHVYTPAEDETLPSIEPVITGKLTADHVEKYVRLTDTRIIEGADGSLTIADLTDEPKEIKLSNAFECDITGNSPESGYVLTGLLLPKNDKSVPRSKMTLAADEDEAAAPLTLDDLEFVPMTIEKRRPAHTPTYEITGEESIEDGKVVTVEDVVISLACDEQYSTIEYSLDGGATWKPYAGVVTVGESAEFAARAIVPGHDYSTPLALSIKREYYSAEAKITPTAKGGYTEVAIAPEAEGLAADSYKIYYTTDGTEPTAESTLYTAPIESEKAASIRALVVENGKRPGKASEPVAVSVRAHDLEITPEKGEGFTTVTIAPKDPKHLHQSAEIRYTTDGSEPTAGSALYTAPFEVEAAQNGMTVKAVCIEPEKTAGQVAAATIAVEGLRPSCDVDITLTENSGTYYITLTAEAGDIWYRIGDKGDFVKYDGTPIEYTPTANGTYTVSAYALEEGKKAGKTATENIVVTGISGIEADGEADGVRVEGNAITVPEGAQTFDIAGRRVNPQGLSRGIYIVRLASGKAVKVVIR